MNDTTDTITVLDVDDPVEVTPRQRTRSSGALVPYKANVPALVPGALGDIDAYIRAANAAPMLTAQEERDLAIKLRETGDLQAAQKLTFSHLRLVVSVARGYLGYGLPHADLIQEGNIGLMKAIKHYDPERGVRLMTFAVHWIRSEIQDYVIKNWRLVKLATTKNQRKLFFNLRQMRDDEKTLTTEEAKRIATSLNVKPEEVFDMEERMSGGDTPIETPDAGEDEGGSFAPIDWLTRDEDSPVQVLTERAKERLTRDGLRTALANLDERSRRVIFARWLNEDQEGNIAPLTLQELAAELGVSAERVRQIEKKALATMRDILRTDKENLD